MSDLTVEDQLAAWLDGDSKCPNTQDSCCPDFSCCRPELQAPIETRQAFVNGTEETRTHLLGGFLGAALASHKVHIAGSVPVKEDA